MASSALFCKKTEQLLRLLRFLSERKSTLLIKIKKYQHGGKLYQKNQRQADHELFVPCLVVNNAHGDVFCRTSAQNRH